MAKKSTYEELAQRIQALERNESKNAEKALQVSEKRFRTIFEQAAVGVAQIISKTGEFIRINQRYADIVGYTVEEMEQLTFQKISHPDDLLKDLDNMQLLLDGEIREFSMEKRYYHKNGSIVWVNLTASPMWEIGEEPNYHVAVVEDITYRKRAEGELILSEQKLALHFLQTPLGVIEWDLDFKVRAWNPAAEKIFGYTEGEILGKHASVIVPKKYKDHVDNIWAALLHQKGGTRSTNENITKKGKTVFCQWFNTPIIDESGKTIAVFSLIQDITERMQTEKALRESEIKHKTLVNNIPGMIYRAYSDWSAEVISGSEAICGYTKKELMSKKDNWLSIIQHDDKEKVFKNGSELTKAQKEIVQTYRIKTKGGHLRWVEDRKTSIFSEKGNFLGIDGVVFDITERKQAEEEKRKALEFTAEQSKHALIGQIAGKMAHDFNNVLMGIMGNAELATMNCSDKKVKEKLKRILDLSERGKNITRNLMTFSIDQEPKQTYFKIEEKIDLVLQIFEKDLAGIKVSKIYKPRIPKLLGDPGMIQDVLTNIIQNSIHAMSKVKNPILNLKAYSQDDKVYFEIEDNGCGIPKEHQDSIYTPSFTLKGRHDKTGFYKSEIKGTGYGMSNVKKYIVEKHKGDIFLESEVGKGTRITIALGIIKNHLSSDEKKEVVIRKIYDKRRILLVEDESAIADVQYQILTQKPFSHIVSTAVNGQMAIDIFDRNKFDAVSLDYVLPGNINGLDVYNHLRENDKDIPVMFISGNIEFLESMKKLKEKDPNLEHLSKPVNNLDYVNKINELIGRSIK